MSHVGKAVGTVLATLGVTLSVGCDSEPKRTPAPAAEPPHSAYLAPPQVTKVRGEGGALVLEGTGAPLARIRLARPDGSAIGVGADGQGRWTTPVAAGAGVQLFSLSQDVDGRVLRAVGYLAVYPDGAAVLRPGAGARILGGGRGLRITALDYDGSGAAVVSARARPSDQSRLALDGVDAGEARADAQGRVSLALPGPLRGGVHHIALHTPTGAAEVGFTVSAPHITNPPSASARSATGWRIDWVAPGGGVQSTMLFDAPGAAG